MAERSEQRREYQRLWEKADREKNPEKYLERKRLWRKANPEKCRDEAKRRNEYTKAWRAENRDKCRAYGRKSYHKTRATNPEVALKQQARNRKATQRYQVDPEFAERRRSSARRGSYKAKGVAAMAAEALVMSANKCEICGALPSESRHGRLVPDHCHATGKIRGALCSNCNSGIGLLGDSVDIVIRAAMYLGRDTYDGESVFGVA